MKKAKKKVSQLESSGETRKPNSATAQLKKKNNEELGEDLTMKESEENQKKQAPDEEL